MALSKQCQLSFAQQLLNLLDAGLALLNAIELIQSSAPSKWHYWLEELKISLQNGNSFSQSLATQKNGFSPEFINLIRVSERTGDISLALKTIIAQFEAQLELSRKLQQALSYPIITLMSSMILLVIMMIWVVPVFNDVFAQFQAELPLPTKALIQISSTINQFFIEIVVSILSLALLFCVAWMKSALLQKQCDQWCFQIPILGKLFRLATLTYWCRTLGHLLDCGLPLPDALRVTAQSSNHWLTHDYSAEVFKHLTRGWSLGEALMKADPKHLLFDVETLQLIRISSDSGFLSKMLHKRAHTLGSELSNRLSHLSQTLEPFLIISVGIIIGSLVIIMYLPIFNLGQIV